MYRDKFIFFYLIELEGCFQNLDVLHKHMHTYTHTHIFYIYIY